MSTEEKGSGSSDPKVNQLLKEGMAAARAGDKEMARAKLREVVTLDQYNEKGWFWLASVVESDEERRVCLGNVVVINPNNFRAQELLDRLTQREAERAESGISPKTLRTAGIVVGVVLVMLVVAVALFGGSAPSSQTVTPTAPPTGTPDAAQLTSTVEVLATFIEATRVAVLTQRALPPTWTPRPSPTLSGILTATPLAPPPPGLAGRLVAVAGRALTLDGYRPLVLVDPTTGETTPLAPGERGDYGILSPDGQRLIYGRFVSGTRPQLLLHAVNLNGTLPELMSARWGNSPPLSDQKMVSISANGKALVFVANNIIVENDSTSDIYYLPVDFPRVGTTPTATLTPSATATLEPSPLPDPSLTVIPTSTWTPSAVPTATLVPIEVQRVTELDSGVNTWPDVSPDGQRVVFVRDSALLGRDGTDVYVVPIEGGRPTNLTNDYTENTEAAPRWSPDGAWIAFQSAPRGQKQHDIYLMDANGSNRRLLVSGGDNVRPHWSPDGRYIAFSSDRAGKWEIFIVEVETGELYQLTSSSDPIIATDWGN